MKGKPKFQLNEQVQFTIEDKTVKGNVYIIDKYGVFEDDSDVCYDIMEKDENGEDICLWKHINEKSVKKYEL